MQRHHDVAGTSLPLLILCLGLMGQKCAHAFLQTRLPFTLSCGSYGLQAYTPPSLHSSSSPLLRRRARLSTSLAAGPTEGAPTDIPIPASSDDVVFEGPIKTENTERFICDISIPEPIAAELEETNLVKIVKLACKDEEVNWLAWKCLGYRYVPTEGRWDNSNVFPKWRARYPEPPDLVGVTRIYEKEVDAPVKRANTALVRSVPKMYKQSLKELLAPYGFKGFKIAELTPNRTRRAQVCNWLLYFKRELWGVSLEKLIENKEAVTSVTREGETSEQLAKKMVY